MNNVTAIASGGTYSCGVYNNYVSPTIIKRSTLKGDAEDLKTIKGTATLTQSTIMWGAPVEEDGVQTRVLCDDGEGLALDKDCHPIPGP